jgi:orotidine-5'-phosphate decarboxylase
MNKAALVAQIKQKSSYLCIGLDPDLKKLPPHLLKEADPIFAFNQQLIDATHDLCVAYKPNAAFYEAYGSRGWESLEKTAAYLPKDTLNIIDAKRGDIGNTAEMYAEAFLEKMNFDAITLQPYMGSDSVLPFLAKKDKWAIILALTSNPGSADFQQINCGNEMLYERLLRISATWGSEENTMYVVGATHPEAFIGIRNIVANHFLLVPGVGAQGGDLEKISEAGLSKDVGLLINASRSIIYAGNGKDFAIEARKEALALQTQMDRILNTKHIY